MIEFKPETVNESEEEGLAVYCDNDEYFWLVIIIEKREYLNPNDYDFLVKCTYCNGEFSIDKEQYDQFRINYQKAVETGTLKVGDYA